MARVYQRHDRDGDWYLDYKTPAGRRVRVRLGKDEKLAKLTLADFELKRQRGELGFEASDISVEKFFEKVVQHSKTVNSAAQTLRVGFVFKHFKGFLAKEFPRIARIEQLTPEVFDRYQQYRLSSTTKKSKKPIKRKTVNIECQAIKTALARGIEWGLLKENPCRVKKLKEVDSKKVRSLTASEVQSLLIASRDHWLYPVIVVMLYAGLRSGECRFLQWKDIDFARKVVMIRRKEGWIPKSSGGEIRERDVFIPEHLVAFLQRHKLASRHFSDEWVFHGKDGGQLSIGLGEAFKAITAKLDCKDVTQVHALRHTYVTHLLKSGADIVTVQEQAGHRDIKTTRKYIDVFESSKRKAAEALNYNPEPTGKEPPANTATGT